MVAGSTAEDHALDQIVMSLHISPGSQGTHAVAKKVNGKVGIFCMSPFSHHTHIINHCCITAGVYVSPALMVLYARAVATVVVGDTDDSMFRHEFHHRQEPFLESTHSMRYLQYRHRRHGGTMDCIGSGRGHHYADVHPIITGTKDKCLFHIATIFPAHDKFRSITTKGPCRMHEPSILWYWESTCCY